MMYNNAEFMGVPWETLVKMHRDGIASRGMATVNDYAESFLAYISNETICNDMQKTANLLRIAEGLFERMSREVRAGSVADPSLSQGSAVSEIIERHATALRDAGDAPSIRTLTLVACFVKTKPLSTRASIVSLTVSTSLIPSGSRSIALLALPSRA